MNLLLQYYYTFSERQKEQLIWSRCINTTGHPGANIPCDLFMEHLNRKLKMVIRSMGANSPSSIQRAGKAIASVQQVCQAFERQTAFTGHCDCHPSPSFGKDFESVLELIKQDKVFHPISIRKHNSFNFKCGLMEQANRTKESWKHY